MATSLHTRPNDYVYYANIAGQGIALKRVAPELGQLRLKTQPGEHRSYFKIAGMPGAFGTLSETILTAGMIAAGHDRPITIADLRAAWENRGAGVIK